MTTPIKSNSGFPLKQSLFYLGRDGNPNSTWCWLDRKRQGAENNWMYKKLAEYKSNTIMFIIYAPRAGVNPYKNNATPEQIVAGKATLDMAEVDRWKELLKAAQSTNFNLFPCLFFGDHEEIMQNQPFLYYAIPAIIKTLEPYASAFVMACEANRGWSQAEMMNYIRLAKGSMVGKVPVGVHMATTNLDKVPTNADFNSWEFSWNPNDGLNHTAQEGVKEAEYVIKHTLAPNVFFEDCVYPENPISKARARALAGVSGVWGLPGPT